MTNVQSKLEAPANVRRLPHPVPDNSSPSASRSLSEAVQAATRRFPENTLKCPAGREAGLAFQPRILLALLSYCYARETYGSAAVEARLRGDSRFRQLCQNHLPDARTLREFRQANRQAVQLCLEAALRFLVEEEAEAGTVTRLDETQLAQEANRRILIATFIDSLDLKAERRCVSAS